GKTSVMSKLIEEAAAQANSDQIVVIDFGPDVKLTSGKKLGGKLELSSSMIDKIQYYAPRELYAPRAMGKTRYEVISLAQRNLASIDQVLNSVERNQLGNVFVNDVTMYFHCGNADRIIGLARASKTFIANGYKGNSLTSEDKGSGISAKEVGELEKLSSVMDGVIELD
ncbi:MAG: hypothetical protein ACRDF4_05270, partial [Rhabdochlamydiaceae bacterium]